MKDWKGLWSSSSQCMSSLSLALSQSFLNTFQVQIYKFSDTDTWDSSIISFAGWNFGSFLINAPALASLHSPWWETLFQEEQIILLLIGNRLHCCNVQSIPSNGLTKHLNSHWNCFMKQFSLDSLNMLILLHLKLNWNIYSSVLTILNCHLPR